MNAFGQAKHALQQMIRIHRPMNEDETLRIEPYVLPVGDVDPQPKVKVSKGYPKPRSGWGGQQFYRVGLIISETEARWLHTRLGELLADLPPAAEKDI